MGGDDRVVGVLGLVRIGQVEQADRVEHRALGEHLKTGLGQFPADQAGEDTADQPREDREEQVQRADILVVRREQPAFGEVGLVLMRVVVMRVIVRGSLGSHDRFLS